MKRFFPIAVLCSLAALIVIGLILIFRSNGNSSELTLYGNVDVREVDIAFRVSGQVRDLCFEEGDFVPKGALLACLDQAPYDEKVKQAKANLDAIETDLKNADILLKRRQELIQIGGVSQEDLDNAQTERNQLVSNVLAARASYNIATDEYSYTMAYAPNDGFILTRIREPGSVVRDTDPVYTLSLSDPIWIRAYVTEPNLGRIRYGMKATIRTDTEGGKSYYGKVGFISPVAEFTPKSVETTSLRTDLVYRIRIYVEHPDQGLKQGMPVTVEMHTQEETYRSHE